MAIQVNNISKWFGKQKALDQVSFEVTTGEVVGFLGPNGAGKSTLMKIITGYRKADEGQVMVNGLNLATSPKSYQAQIGYLPEHNPLYLDMYVKEYLYFVANLYGISNKKKAVENAIERTKLTPEYKKKIGALSKGYRQRVGISQAIIHNPSVLILDEPTTGLDPNQIVEIRELIKQIGQDKTVFLSTHIMQEVESICNRVLILDKGKLIANDTQERVRSRQHLHLQVAFSTPVEVQQLQAVHSSIVKVSSAGEAAYLIEASSLENLRESVFDFAVAQQLKIKELHLQSSSIEDRFIELTN